MIEVQMNDVLNQHGLANELQQALQLAVEAGDIVCRIRAKGYQVWEKGGSGSNPVTEADKAASDHLIKKLSSLFPDDLIISEEAPVPTAKSKNQRIWYIDPIDGTKEFIKGINEWSVMIGLAINGRPQVGVVYQPQLGQFYYAVKDGGSYFITNQKTSLLHVNDKKSIHEAILIQSRSHWSPEAKAIAEHFGIVNTIQHGSIGLKLGLIARGEADLYMNFSGHCHLWDICGPEIIINEAGGKVITQSGMPFNYQTTDTRVEQNFAAATAGIADVLSPCLINGNCL